MIPCDLENEVMSHDLMTPKSWYVLDIVLKTPVLKLGESWLNSFLGIRPQAQISKTMTPGDLENEVATHKSWYRQYIALKTLAHKLGESSFNGFLGICPQAQTSKTMTPDDLEDEVMTPKSGYKQYSLKTPAHKLGEPIL